MRAAVLRAPGTPLEVSEMPAPSAGPGEVLVHVRACGVCRTDLHIVDGELRDARLPLVPGHQIVGVVVRVGAGVAGIASGTRVGIPWLGWTCGVCRFCASGRENLCERARFTGYQIDGGFADLCVADARYCFPLPEGMSDAEMAPLLCAGLVGYRALRMSGSAERVGLYGFGSAAHIIIQIARHQGKRVYAFTRPGDREAQGFARSLGAEWVGDSTAQPPEELDCGIIFAADGRLVPKALGDVARGGTVICAGIHMSEIPAFPYDLLWGERSVRSVANLTRADARELLEAARLARVRTTVSAFPLEDVNEALALLRQGRLVGSAVVVVEGEHA
jgi:propanol-preferring alcohol dehydrogenase